VLRIISEESKRNGTNKMTQRQIDQESRHTGRKRKALMLPLRLVIDRNVLVSAALNPDGLQRTTILIAITKPARLYA
jgi:hypothetical protein